MMAPVHCSDIAYEYDTVVGYPPLSMSSMTYNLPQPLFQGNWGSAVAQHDTPSNLGAGMPVIVFFDYRLKLTGKIHT